MTKNIAFIHAGFPGGGAERVTRDIAKYLNGVNGAYKVYVFTRSVHKGLLLQEDEENITVIETKRIDAEMHYSK